MALSLRQQEILRILVSNHYPLKIDFFTEQYSKSERTIRNDIQNLRNYLKDFGIQIKVSIKHGFYIPATQKSESINCISKNRQTDNTFEDYESDKNRNKNILLYLLSRKDPISADDLGYQFYVSRSTVLRNLQEIKHVYSNKVQINAIKSQGFVVSGDEHELRIAATEIVRAIMQASYSEEEWYAKLPLILKEHINLNDIVNLSNAIRRSNTEYDVWISNPTFLILLAYTIIRKVRQSSKASFNWATLPQDQIDSIHGRNYIVDLIRSIDRVENYTDENEIYSLMQILSSNDITIRNEQPELNTKLDSAIKSMITELKNITSISFDLATLYKDLYQHLRYFLNMQSVKLDEEVNSVLARTKSDYYEFYQLSSSISERFNKAFELELSEAEIQYIAIYLYKNALNINEANKKILIICSTGKGLSSLLTTRIKRVFPNLIVIGSVSAYQIENFNFKNKIDFIISTIPIATKRYPIVRISPILTQEDIRKIQEHINYRNIEYESSVDTHSLNGIKVPNVYDKMLHSLDLTDQSSFAKYTEVVSDLIIELLDIVSRLPKEYQLDHDVVLGLTIHLVLALPRWFEETKQDSSIDELYKKIKEKHPVISTSMDKYFNNIENLLHVTISVSEKYAFYLYILK